MKRALILIALLVVAAMACSSLTNLLPGGGGGSGSIPEGGAIFEDDFSDPGSGWEVGDYPGGSVGYKSGTYFVTSTGEGTTMWGVAGRNFSNVVIQVDATQISAPANDNNDYGVICRLQQNADGYYLLISGDGLFSILLAENDLFTPLVDWTPSDAINQGDRTNSITVVCDGSTLSLSANDQLLATIEDSTFRSGDIALTATSYESEMTEVQFDNLAVTEPD